jgi:phage shock protein PspC (stress-responsive transcriptional regulator)
MTTMPPEYGSAPTSTTPPSTTPPSTTPPSTTPAGARFFDAIRRYSAVRPDHGRWLAGVCAGLARRWGMSPTLVRVLFVLFGMITGIGLAVYGVLWLLLPHPDGRIHAQQVLTGRITAGFVGGVLAILVDRPFDGWWAFGPAGWPQHHGSALLPILLVVGLIWWLVRRGTGRPR